MFNIKILWYKIRTLIVFSFEKSFQAPQRVLFYYAKNKATVKLTKSIGITISNSLLFSSIIFTSLKKIKIYTHRKKLWESDYSIGICYN